MGDFNPKVHTAEEKGYDANDNYVRGLKMPEKGSRTWYTAIPLKSKRK